MAGPPAMQIPLGKASVATAPAAEDAELVRAAQRDPRAFAHLYLRYIDPVYRYCQRRLVAKEAAEDATSLVFAKALAALPQFRSESLTFRSWLFVIAHNVVVDAQRTGRVVDRIDAVAEIADDAPGPEAALLADEERWTVDGLLREMAVDQRRVLELRLAGLSTAEIAVALGRKPGAVRATQFRAVTRLRQLLNRDSRQGEHGDA